MGFVDYLGIALVYPVFATFLFDPNNPLIAAETSSVARGAFLGLLIGLTPLTQFFSSLFLGRLSDRMGRKTVLIYGTAMGCLGYILAIVGIKCESLFLLFLYRFCIGLSEGTIAVAQALIADMSSPEKKAWHFALFNASLGAGFTLGPFMGGKLADPSLSEWCGYVTPFGFGAILCIVNLLLILWRIPNDRKMECSSVTSHFLDHWHSIRKMCIESYPLKWIFLALFTFSFGWSFFNEFIPLFLKVHFAFSPSEMGNYYAYGGIWFAFSAAVLTAPLLNRFPPEKIVIKSLIGCSGCMLLMIIVESASSLWWIVPPLTFSLSTVFPTLGAIVSNKSNLNNQGEALGIYQSIVGAAMGTSPLIMGTLVGIYPDIIVWGGSLAMFIACGLIKMSSQKKLSSDYG